MNKTQECIRNNPGLLSLFLSAGYPDMQRFEKLLKATEEAGVKLVEIGIPFSDPLADGETIQHSSRVALDSGFQIDRLFDLLKRNPCGTGARVIMTYLNPVLVYGLERFLLELNGCKIDSVIIPDLPIDLYERDYLSLFKKHDVSPVFMIAPGTTPERIRKIDQLSNSFIYAVSANAITGEKKGFSKEQLDYFLRLSNYGFRVPVLAGFGISEPGDMEVILRYFHGGICGSAFLKHLERLEFSKESPAGFIKKFTNKNSYDYST